MAHDFNLHAPKGANKQKKILGRGQGSGRGTTSGKGNKGQKARSGGKTYAGFEGGQMPLYRRLAQRGFSNYPFKKTFQIVNICDIDKRKRWIMLLSTRKGLSKERKKNGIFTPHHPVKILANGELNKKLTFKISAISESAKEKIQKAGGELVSSETQRVSHDTQVVTHG